jgi:hypothetical protein
MTRSEIHVSAMLGLALFLAGASGGPLEARSGGHVLAVPLSDPTRPATLSVSMLHGSIHIEAHDGGEVTVEVRGEDDVDEPEEEEEGREGLRRIPNTSLGLTIEEDDNVVEVNGDWSSEIEVLHVRVPRRTSLRLSCTNCDEMRVDGVTGEHELSSTNGDIAATNLGGSAVVSTTNGDVEVAFREITAGKAMSFITFNGDIEVTFPALLQADLRINSGRGEIFTDFDVEIRPQEPRVERDSDGRTQKLRLEQEVRATVGGGGPELRFKTFNGDVVVRKSAPR